MGLDFIRRAAKTFTKSWNRGVSQLAQPTLFTRYPQSRARTVVACLNDGVTIPEGEQLLVCVRESKLALIRGTAQIGVIDAPPNDLFREIQDAGGSAVGSIAGLHALSGTADVEIE
jgi:hypothetical protein